MDLCLKGSQINLATRQKPKPKFSSQTNLYQSVANTHSRPRSATFFSKRSRSSPFLGRPQSAEPKCGQRFGSTCGHYCSERSFSGGFGRNQKRYQSVSSSSLLKLLLDEPIKRSWLCHGSTSSPDNQSDLSSGRRNSPTYFNRSKRTRTESAGGSSVEGDHFKKLTASAQHRSEHRKTLTNSTAFRMSSASSLSSLSRDKSNYSSAASLRSSDYWRTTANSNPAKPDLPGRVSFSKPNLHNEPDFSDCDNDKQEQYSGIAKADAPKEEESISAPGPLTLPTFSFGTKAEFSATPTDVSDYTAPNSAAAAKKSVHFGAASGSEGVLAETFEYPKCPSENCSCSTRSSSTASMQDGADVKCSCDSPTCKYVLDTHRRRLSLSQLEDNAVAGAARNGEEPLPAAEELEVIREYKNAVGEQVENSIVKNILEDRKSKYGGFGAPNNAMELPAYLEKYASPKKTDINLEKQNNLSEATKQLALFKTSVKKNLVTGGDNQQKADNNYEHNLKMQASYTTSSESVINNYLKVAASAPLATKKKENNRPESSEASTVSVGRKAKNANNQNAATQRRKSPNAKLKKATSFGSLREDSNLDEFNLDKVDSWMSMHEQTMQARKSLVKHTSLDDDFEKLTKCSLGGDDEVDAEEGDEQVDSASQVSTKSDENSQEDSTYDEIVSVIKEIDEDKKKDNYAEKAASELELKLNTKPEPGPTPSNAMKMTVVSKSPDKFKDILTYLDNVEDSCDRTLLETRRSIPDSNRSEVEFVVEPDIAEDVPKLTDLLMLPNHQLARRVIALSLRANELANAVYLSKEHVMKIRTEKQKSIRSEKANAANRMREQKKHYEAVVKRHQGFIEQLLKDKGSLCEKVAALTRRLESQNQAWEHKLETELARVKETTLAGEKIRRERWVRENTKKIKELTVKGLETEINKMTCNHQREVTELKQAHQQQLLDALEEARQKHEQIESSIRESCAQDRETIIEKERTAIRERFERQLEEERKSFDEQRQKLCEDFASERERLQNDLKAKEADYQVRRQELQREKEYELEQTVAELQEKMCKQDEKYQNRINTIEKQYESDFEIWKKEYENSCKVAQADKENTIRQHYRAERDRQIDAIVSRMDAEALKNAEEYELKLSRLKEKYEKDLQAVESVEKSLREKYTETRSKLAEADAQVRNYEAEIKQFQMELGHSKKMCDDFLSERDQLRDNLRNEIQNEVSSLKIERDNEIQKIHKRVQQAIEKKDATIDILQKENGSLRERCLKLEAVIRQQRKDYCVK